MAAFRHLNRRLPFAAAGIQHPQFPPANLLQHAIQVLPQNGLPQLSFGRAVNVTGKLFSNVIKIAILHRTLHRLAQALSDKTAILSQPRPE
ncbi:Uncharacterised protein [Salmonella enterica subsp. enterica serovar Bovismorbificans]|uniref:Uncharacterized protein n=1 Tax=Salmonella enterica subsp. enterica serovar Bovismorbificans TaxID=58097 RepID=A0A655E7E0_SALET|nr:Uncharacterised protein [Salmonella enterica subsp. enterica serovar Bovismorbificans]CNV07205.1 Uncharacterised protein [Salmonella enterica subsp. enterica serovar Bovismorbificans]